jgi:Cys-tRNA(Pro)/Cys-tRNA(Cys) deacylase
MEKTLSMRLLEGKKIPYQVAVYPDTERDAVKVAAYLESPPGGVFKTLVVERDRGKPILAVIPADCNLDLKAVARTMNEKKVRMASHSQAEAMTGLQVGGISPLALVNKGFVVLIDRSAESLEQFFISAGKKGINLKVPVDPVRKLLRAQWADISAD